jgi:leucyl/phenylalanyl-tRNA---protein transferase
VRTIVWLSAGDPPDAFPPVGQALTQPDGLLAAGGDLAPARIVAAYRRGIFPWYSPGQPILWWSPDPRAVLEPGALRVTRSLAKSMRNRGYRTTIDAAFESVIALCASPEMRPGGTWISADMRRAYVELHARGLAHSVETWLDDELVGGLYGVALGRVFFGESMFARARDASKVALVRLCDGLRAAHYRLIDCQMATGHLERLGARLMPRREFIELLAREADPPDDAFSRIAAGACGPAA